MTLAVPDTWKVDANSDLATVANGHACFYSNLLDRDLCPGFEVNGPDGIAHGYEDGPYRLDHPFHPGTDVSPCTTAPDDALERNHQLAKAGFAKVGPRPPTTGPGESPAFPPTATSPPASHMSSGSGTCPSPRSWSSMSGRHLAWLRPWRQLSSPSRLTATQHSPDPA